MMKKLLLLVLLIVCASGVYAQDDCYQRSRKTGITLYNNGDYENAEKKFNQADACADKPADNDIKTWLQKCADAKVSLSLNRTQSEFNSNGGKTKVEVYTNATDYTVEMPSWCYITDKLASSFQLNCKANTTANTRSGEVVVVSGAKRVKMKVVQYGNATITVDSQSKEFSNKGGKHTFTIGGNAPKWEVSAPEWIACDKKDAHILEVTCSQNDGSEMREGTIKIYAGGNEVSIAVTQRAGDYVDVQEVLDATYDEKTYEIKISASSDRWRPESDVAWIQITNISHDGITINISQNNNASVRTGGVKIILGDIEKEILVRQEAKSIVKTEKINESKTKGKDFYFGVKFGGSSPKFTVKSSNVLSSVMDYGHTDVASLKNMEKPSYKSQLGFFVLADVNFRLVDNLYFNTGLGFEHFSVKNEFSSTQLQLNNGDEAYGYNMKFKEKYKMNYLNVPIKVAYRYSFGKNMAVSGNLGVIVGIGTSAKLDVDGNIYAKIYDWDGNSYVYSGYYMESDVTGDVDLFTGDYDLTNRYKTGAANRYQYKGSKNSPYKRLNMSFALGASFEISMFEIGFNYNLGLTNVANKDYWESGDRVCGDLFLGYDDWHSDESIRDYKQKINVFEFFVGLKF